MAKNNIYTSGYEGEDIQQFIIKLKENNINIVIDIRERPQSRKKGFSKAALETKLNESHIDYIHYKQLGSPKDIRQRLHDDWNYESFFNDYRNYLKTQQEVLCELKETIVSQNACLLCFEKDYKTCHRIIVAEELNNSIFNNTLNVINI